MPTKIALTKFTKGLGTYTCPHPLCAFAPLRLCVTSFNGKFMNNAGYRPERSSLILFSLEKQVSPPYSITK